MTTRLSERSGEEGERERCRVCLSLEVNGCRVDEEEEEEEEKRKGRKEKGKYTYNTRYMPNIPYM